MMNIRQKIILVDDSKFDKQFVELALQEIHFNGDLLWFEDGPVFLDYLQTHGSQDIVFTLLDIKMPKLSGLEVLERIRQLDSTPFPIIMFSASKQESDIATSKALGACAFVIKPVSFDEFTDTISGIWHFWGRLNEFSKQTNATYSSQ